MNQMTEQEEKLYDLFDEIGITQYTVREHQAVFTSQEAEEAGLDMPGLNLKNLLIKDKKDGRFYLVILDEHRKMERSHFKALTGWSSKVTFAGEAELWSLLRLTPGSVSPFGLIFDTEKRVTVVLDRTITFAPEEELVNFHPNRNTATLGLTKGDFLHFLRHMGNSVIFEK